MNITYKAGRNEGEMNFLSSFTVDGNGIAMDLGEKHIFQKAMIRSTINSTLTVYPIS